MEMKQIRMGIVGAGTWGETHASIYAEHLFADPVAICDMKLHVAHDNIKRYDQQRSWKYLGCQYDVGKRVPAPEPES